MLADKTRLEELGITQDFVEKFLDRDCVEIGRLAIEDAAIELRDIRVSTACGNGIVCHESNGSPSSIIRLSTIEALMIGLCAMLGIKR